MSFTVATNYLLGTINETLSRRDAVRSERMELLLAELDNPHLAYPTIHVGGTSGKGSTSTMIAAMMTSSGRRCGLHTKPHLSTMRERAQISGKMISEVRFGLVLESMRHALDRVAALISRPSFYETLLALAFLYFAEEQVDVAVIEVGIGGRLDGTNFVEPLVSVITNVGLDHCEILGTTVEAIATEKAGITKPHVPMVSAAEGTALAILAEKARELGAPFFDVRHETSVKELSHSLAGQHFQLGTPRATYDLATRLLGRFQQRNAATAVLALEQLPETLRPTVEDIERGFLQLAIPGRMEYVPAHPGVIFDIAHNPDKIRSLAEALTALFSGRRLHFVIAISDSKEMREMLRELEHLPASFMFTSFEAPGRSAVRPERLATYLQRTDAWVRVIYEPIEAFSVVRRSAGTDDIVVVTGSTVIVGVIREWWSKNMQTSLR